MTPDEEEKPLRLFRPFDESDIPDLTDFGDAVPDDKPLDYEVQQINTEPEQTPEQKNDLSMQAIVMGAAVVWQLDAEKLAKALILLISLHVVVNRKNAGDNSELNQTRLDVYSIAAKKLDPRLVAAAFDCHELLAGYVISDTILDDAHSIALAMNAENN